MVAVFGPNGMARKRSGSNSDLPSIGEGVALPLPLFVVDANGEPSRARICATTLSSVSHFFSEVKSLLTRVNQKSILRM